MKLEITLLRNLAMACAMIGFAGIVLATPPSGLPGSRGAEKAAEHSNKVFNREAALRQRQEIHEWLMTETVTQGLGAPISAVFSKEEKAGIDRLREVQCRSASG